MTGDELLEYIFIRIAQTGGAVFSDDEIKNWPTSITNILLKHEILQRAQPARVVECKGCEENCIMPVNVFPAENKQPARAFVACDKRNDVGLVPVDISRLQQWQSTIEMIATNLMVLLQLPQITPKLVASKQWHIGVLQGKKHKSPILLLSENNLSLSLAGYTITLLEVLSIQENTLALDKSKLLRLVDKPTGSSETPEDRRKRLKSRIREEKAKGTKAFLKVVAKEEGISVSRLKQIIDK